MGIFYVVTYDEEAVPAFILIQGHEDTSADRGVDLSVSIFGDDFPEFDLLEILVSLPHAEAVTILDKVMVDNIYRRLESFGMFQFRMS